MNLLYLEVLKAYRCSEKVKMNSAFHRDFQETFKGW